MVQSMYPPLDPRLLEARAAALSLAVSHLALIAKYECGYRDRNSLWIDKSLAEMDGHMVVSCQIFILIINALSVCISIATKSSFLGSSRSCFDSRSY